MILPSRTLMPVIREALTRGQRVRMTVTGSSMWPFVCDSDVLELEPAPAPRLGDMVLVQTNARGEADRYVLHRVVRVDGGTAFFVRGDAQPQGEGPFAPDALVGRVTTLWRNGRPRDQKRGLWRLAGLVWMRYSSFGSWPFWLAARIRGVAGSAVRWFRRHAAGPPDLMPDLSEDSRRLIALLSGLAIDTAICSEEDWRRIVELAVKQHVAPVLHARLTERGITPSAAATDRLRRIYLANAGRNTRLLHEVGNILRALRDNGIPVIPLKGACLAEAIYGNIALRQMGDVDLWIQRKHLDAARQVMQLLGYVSRSKTRRPQALQDALTGETQMFKTDARWWNSTGTSLRVSGCATPPKSMNTSFGKERHPSMEKRRANSRPKIPSSTYASIWRSITRCLESAYRLCWIWIVRGGNGSLIGKRLPHGRATGESLVQPG